jgi:hypothetical protein
MINVRGAWHERMDNRAPGTGTLGAKGGSARHDLMGIVPAICDPVDSWRRFLPCLCVYASVSWNAVTRNISRQLDSTHQRELQSRQRAAAAMQQ